MERSSRKHGRQAAAGGGFATLVLVSLVATGCPPPPPMPTNLPPITVDTSVGPTDEFEVRVMGQEQLSGAFQVASDGTIDFPLVGRILVAGRQPQEISQAIRQALIDLEFLRDPQVTVLVTQYRSKKISVLGQVQHPGTFDWEEGVTIIQAIALAGGFGPLADRNQTQLTRVTREGEEVSVLVPVEEIEEGRQSDILLQPNDRISVPQRFY
ncbi:MAG: polysaccharide export protein [Deltaproteobacteria bacterium]|nr:polysaccharide export protein [Deltaproteobacteria bacterium]